MLSEKCRNRRRSRSKKSCKLFRKLTKWQMRPLFNHKPLLLTLERPGNKQSSSAGLALADLLQVLLSISRAVMKKSQSTMSRRSLRKTRRSRLKKFIKR